MNVRAVVGVSTGAAFAMLVACSSSSDGGDAAGTGAAAGSSAAGASAAGAAGAGTGGSPGTGGAAGTSAAGTSAAGTSAAGASGAAGTSAGAAGTGTTGGSGGAAGAGGSGPATCPVGDPPANLPTFQGEFVQLDDMGTNGPPAMTGGDASGTWVFTALKQYLPASTSGLVDASMSTVSGTAWSRLGADGSFALSTHFDISLSTAAGPIVRTSDTQSSGTFVTSMQSLTPTATCSTNNDTMVTIEFTRTGDTGQFLLHTSSQLGQIDLLLSGDVTK